VSQATFADERGIDMTEKHKGQPSVFSGKVISLSPKTEGHNIRKEGTGGWKSMEIVRKAGRITYDDFIIRGGRRVDLIWDCDRGNYDLR
jgi:hypothetical protein